MSGKNRKKASGTEYCKGFVDKHGQWNNGFYCPKWGGPDIQYCCGPDQHKYCCPKEETLEKLHDSQTQQLSLLIGLAIGSFLLLLGTLILSCYFCRCCWAYKRRKRAQGSPSLPAYSSYPRDSIDPVNYTVCPHGAVFPEFMIPVPPYPNEAPPPYPGDEPAVPLEEKAPMSPRSVGGGHNNNHEVVNDPPPPVDAPIERPAPRRHCCTNGKLHSAVIPHDRCHGCCHEQSSPTPEVMPSTSRHNAYQIPKIKSSHHHRHHTQHKHHHHHRGRHSKHRSNPYDSRSITSSDSDTFST